MKKANISSNIKKKKNEMILKLTIKYNYYMLNRRDHFEAITSETNESTWEELLYVKLSKKTLTISQNLLIKWGNTKKKKIKRIHWMFRSWQSYGQKIDRYRYCDLGLCSFERSVAHTYIYINIYIHRMWRIERVQSSKR